MAFNIDALSAYVGINGKTISTQAVLGATTAKLLIGSANAQFGVKGSEAIRKMDADSTIQLADGCSRTASGAITLSNATLTVKPLADLQDVCTKAIWNTIFADMLSKGQTPTEDLTPDLMNAITDLRSKKVASNIEQMLWNSDSTLTGATNLKHFNGIRKQVGTGTTYTVTGSTIVAKLQHAYLQMPVAERSADDFRMFIGKDSYDSYLVALANLNIYKPTEDRTVFGTAAKFEVVEGLNESGKVYMTRLSNLQLGMDGTGDEDNVQVYYDPSTKNTQIDYYFAVGVAVVRPTIVGIASI